MIKRLKIKNRASSPLFFVFCTISTCRCELCMKWARREVHPIANTNGETYGVVAVNGLSEGFYRFCPEWDCKGACFFEVCPSTVTKDMLYDYNECQSYKIGGGKAELCFDHPSDNDAQSKATKYLRVENNGASTLFFCFRTISNCSCDVCQEWFAYEEYPLRDNPSWLVGQLRVEPCQSRVLRFCSRWDCIGTCFVDTWPSKIEKSDLFDYDETEEYTSNDGSVKLTFSHAMPHMERVSFEDNNASTRAYANRNAGTRALAVPNKTPGQRAIGAGVAVLRFVCLGAQVAGLGACVIS